MYKSKDTEVSQGYKVKLDIVIKGDYKADKNTLTVDVAKVDGKWCLVENDFNSLF